MNTRQASISSPFGPASTAREVLKGIDLSGKVAIVTGGYSGIGLETTRALAAAGAKVIVPARNSQRAQSALGGLTNVSVEALDLVDPASIDAFAERFRRQHDTLHLLVNNAGFISYVLERDRRGYEVQFATNHLGHFQLTARLWPAFSKQGARVISVSSRGHALGPVDFDDLDFVKRAYDPSVAYGQSKSANALFAVWLDRLGTSAGVRAYAVHPGGIIESGFSRGMSDADKAASGYLDADGKPIIDPENNKKTPEQGAATSAWCATSPLLATLGGVYCEDCDVAPVTTSRSMEVKGVRPWAIAPDLAERLWALSVRLTGVSIPADGRG
jgi:NAD(P)-dependent dehydrogenase (short-subunit alcohol dehydrogenase family)